MCHQFNLETLFPVNRFNAPVFDFVKQIDQVYRGLGIPTLYGTLSILANKSVFFIGDRGTGKTRIIKLIPSIEGTETSKWDTFTLQELNYYCKELSGNQNLLTDNHLVFKVEDFSTLSDYHREIFLTVCSKISSDGNYKHITKQTPCLDIRNCKLNMLIAIQPNLYTLLCDRYTQWESMSYDRFTKFVVLNPLRSDTLTVPLVTTLPKKNMHNAILDESQVDLNALVEMFKGHVSEGRATIYARDYAVAIATFLGSEKVSQEHVDLFHKFFYPYLDSFTKLQSGVDLDSPVRISAGSLKLLEKIARYKEPVEKNKLAYDLHVRSIERAAKELLESELIEKPSPHAGKYQLSEQLRKHFIWYENLLPWIPDFPVRCRFAPFSQTISIKKSMEVVKCHKD